MENEVAVVVGAGPGLGWALAKRFSQAGMHVAVTARHPEKLKALPDWDQVGHLRLYEADTAVETDVQRLFHAVDSELGSPSLVVFNAGAFEAGGILDIRPDDFERCWRVGCFGGFLVGQAAARCMVSKAAGTIIFTGASASLRGSAHFANLAVPKFGLRALAQSMARELGPIGIHVAHVVIDGQIDSERYRQLAVERDPDALLCPDSIADAYHQLHRQHRSAWTHELDMRPFIERF